ncbi:MULTISPECIES: 2OG-Fe(II) oxygenase [Ramlibacter]|uniref:Redoxin domain-containing protein n=1 Tax=Ramlibacter pinisoli TaxID=2682844 RepID=A0A6N8INS4_9BURK|nr:MULTISPECIES: 2OG-Fe(II) oxygenase [Ramlibacter]MBA2963543.1 2OG-Fe(II) oxygenase [Ramlibacter sp. CGMCC 1.13660]MVQ28509.1 redoxin domain-containing protein [Ramlibacter pinisoli]
MLIPGTPAPWFVARATGKPRFHIHTMGGHVLVLCFFGSSASPASARVLQDLHRHAAVSDDAGAFFFGISTDPQDEELGRVRDQLPGLRYFWDFDRSVSTLYQAADTPCTVILDERLRVVAVLDLRQEPETHLRRVMAVVRSLRQPAPGAADADAAFAPVLVVPRVFEPALCEALIRYHGVTGGQESGTMREEAGLTVEHHDYGFKRRRDRNIDDAALGRACQSRIQERLLPEVQRAFQFRATRMERLLVACYDASTNDHFRAHRDNTTRGTSHRRFAVSVVLNTGQFEGGELRFPEFGNRLYAPPPGGAVVFSCSLLHEATPVTRGKRYVFLPFLYDEEGARERLENRRYLASRQPAADEGDGAQPPQAAVAPSPGRQSSNAASTSSISNLA